MQEKDAHALLDMQWMFTLFSCWFDQIFTINNSFCKFLFETQPACIS